MSGVPRRRMHVMIRRWWALQWRKWTDKHSFHWGCRLNATKTRKFAHNFTDAFYTRRPAAPLSDTTTVRLYMLELNRFDVYLFGATESVFAPNRRRHANHRKVTATAFHLRDECHFKLNGIKIKYYLNLWCLIICSAVNSMRLSALVSPHRHWIRNFTKRCHSNRVFFIQFSSLCRRPTIPWARRWFKCETKLLLLLLYVGVVFPTRTSR